MNRPKGVIMLASISGLSAVLAEERRRFQTNNVLDATAKDRYKRKWISSELGSAMFERLRVDASIESPDFIQFNKPNRR